VQVPSLAPSASQDGSPSMHVWFLDGKPFTTGLFGFSIAHSRKQLDESTCEAGR